MTFNSPILSKFTPLRLDKYGWRDLGSGRHFHHGVDLRSSLNSIVASADGKVSRIWFEQNGFGNAVYIQHANGYETRYAHLAKSATEFVRVGQEVKVGQRIGTMGTTGNSSGVHLHFEIRKDGQSIDPETLIDFPNRLPKHINNNNNTNTNNMPNFTLPRSQAIAEINNRDGFDIATKQSLVNAVYDNNFSYIISFSGDEPRKELRKYKDIVNQKDTTVTTIGGEKKALENEVAQLKLTLEQYKEELLEKNEKIKQEVKLTQESQINLEDRIQEEKRDAIAKEERVKVAEKKTKMTVGERDWNDTLRDILKTLPYDIAGGVVVSVSDLGFLNTVFDRGLLGFIATILTFSANAAISYITNHRKNERKIQEETTIKTLNNI